MSPGSTAGPASEPGTLAASPIQDPPLAIVLRYLQVKWEQPRDIQDEPLKMYVASKKKGVRLDG